MSTREFQLQGLADPRLSVHATSPLPAWLWSIDGARVLWANAVGARLFGAANVAALVNKTIGPADAHRRQVAQLAGRLSPTGAVRMERLRGFGASPGMLMTLSCARLDFPDGRSGILIAAVEPVRQSMLLIERLRGLVEGFETPVAAFARDGQFAGASEVARPLLGSRDLAGAGLDEAREEALRDGRVEFPIDGGRMLLQRIGSDNDVGVIALIAPDPPQVVAAPQEKPASSEPSATPSAEASSDEPATQPRRHPLRFTWQMDTECRFSLGSDDFTRLIGAHTAAGFGRPWQEISEEFGLDPEGRVVEAIATRHTWSGITVYWPVDGGGRLPVELSGLPIFDSVRNFAGYRGFGVCRDLDSLAHLAEQRRLEPFSHPPTQPTLGADIVPTDSEHAAAAHLPAREDVIIDAPPGAPASLADETAPQTDLDEPVEPPKNVVPFRPPGDPKSPELTPAEDGAFNELARQLSARLHPEDGTPEAVVTGEVSATPVEPEAHEARHEAIVDPAAADHPDWLQPQEPPPRGETRRDRTLLDLLPTGVLIYRLDRLLYANAAFLERLGYDSIHALEQAGGLDALYVEPGVSTASSASEAGTPVTISAGHGASGPSAPTKARLFAITWDGDSALALMFSPSPGAPGVPVAAAAPEPAPPPAPASPPQETGHAEAEDLVQGKRGENELQQARRLADRAANAKADMVARISHEVRSPLNAIIGFAEVMIGERFGTLGNERYVEYLKDIRASGERVMTILNDLTELARIETGKLDLAFTNQNLNELVESCVTVMQPQASRERIIIRTSLAQALPPVVADGRTLRQITLNLIGNSIHLANPAGQVIVSTALSDFGEVILRVRDTGHGLNDNEVAAALEPFRTSPPSDEAADSSPVNLSLTKALVEANRAKFHIKTGGRSGTLIEVVFPHAVARA